MDSPNQDSPQDPRDSNVTPLRSSGEDASAGAGFRSPPHNFEAEMALLGSLLVSNKAYERVGEFLRPWHFADARHGRIFEAAGRLIDAGQIADPITLRDYFEQDSSLEEIGGAEYLARLAGAIVNVHNANDYGRMIFDRHLRRELIGLGEEMVNRAFDYDLDVSATDQIEMGEQGLYQLAEQGEVESGATPFNIALQGAIELAESAYKNDGQLSGVATGLRDLDQLLGGLHKSGLIILAGRPAMGKTSLATNIALNAAMAYREGRDEKGATIAKTGAVVGFFSLEMSTDELATRILAEVSEVSSHDIRRGNVREDDFPRFVQASQTLANLPLFIDDTPALSISALRTRARRLKRQHNLSLIVVDYLQLMQPTPGQRYDGRVQEISEVTRGLKAIAKELDVPVLALSQLSRAVEQRDDKRPHLSDLRESGSIEQDADVVMFVYREEYYLLQKQVPEGDPKRDEWQQEMDRVKNLAEVIVAKQRHGPVGTAELHFEHRFTRFSDFTRDDHLPEAH